jgi:Flp pilus assembly protein TadB
MSAPKVLIENQNALGKNVEQVSLDTNRVNTHSETISRFANFIAISSRGIWVDCSQWLVYSAALTALVRLGLSQGLPLWVPLLGMVLPLYILIVLLLDVCQRRKSLQAHALIRFLLLFIGAAISVI